MRKALLLWLLMSTLATMALAQGHKIQLRFSHYFPQKVRLAYYYEDKQYLQVDSASQSGNTVTFEGPYNLQPGIYTVILDSSHVSFELLVDKQNQNFQMKCDVLDPQKTMKVTGSEMNARFFDYQRMMTGFIRRQNELDTARKYAAASDTAAIDKKISALGSEIEAAWKKTVADNPGTLLADMLSCMHARNYGYDQMYDYVNFQQSGLIRTPFYYNVIRAHIARYLNANASHYEIIRKNDWLISKTIGNADMYHYMTAYMLNFYRTFFKLGINEVFVHLADKYFLADTVKGLPEENRAMIKEQRDIYAASIPGSDARNVRMAKTLTGDSLNILSGNHNTVFLLFWSNGCGHCDSAENALKYYYSELQRHNVTVISVNNDKHSVETLRQNTQKKKFPWLDVCDIEEKSFYRQYYYVVSTPVMYVIDDKNRILQKVVGEDQITETAKRYSGN